MSRRSSLLFLACAAGSLMACGARPAEAPSLPPRVLLVLLDSVRADHVGVRADGQSLTPNLDRLGREGVVFERAYAASSNPLQSLSAIWTGRLPSSGGSIGLRTALPHPSLVSLPRAFLRAGYRTSLISNQPLLRERAFTHGFDRVQVDSEPGRWSAEHVVELAIGEWNAADSAPLFMTVVLGDAAEPHFPPEAFRAQVAVPRVERLLSLDELRNGAGQLPPNLRESPGFLDLMARYAAEVAWVDACLGRLFDAARNAEGNALILVTSMHGTEFLEHGYVGAGWTLHEEVLEVPLILHAPGRLGVGKEESPASLAGLMPSFLRALGQVSLDQRFDADPIFRLTPAGGVQTQASGRVLAELVVPELAILRAAIVEDDKRIEAVRWIPPSDRMALVRGYEALLAATLSGERERPDPLAQAVSHQRFHLASDPGENLDLSPRAAPLQHLVALIQAYLEACRTVGLEPRAARSAMQLPEPADLEELQQLGYL